MSLADAAEAAMGGFESSLYQYECVYVCVDGPAVAALVPIVIAFVVAALHAIARRVCCYGYVLDVHVGENEDLCLYC